MNKRLFDVVVVSLAAIAWVPVVALCSVAVLVLSGRPVFYRSRRWVSPDDAITMAKFRVMVHDASKFLSPVEAGRFLNTPSDSPLYTRVGRFLERVGFTELPQLFHVFNGDMTIVGPRPLTDVVRDCLLEQHPDLDQRWTHERAGLTGLPQLIGREALTDTQRLSLEEAYDAMAGSRYRASIDFKILLFTVLIVLGLKKPLDYEGALALVKAQPQVHVAQQGHGYPAGADADAVA